MNLSSSHTCCENRLSDIVLLLFTLLDIQDDGHKFDHLSLAVPYLFSKAYLDYILSTFHLLSQNSFEISILNPIFVIDPLEETCDEALET